MNHSEAFEWTCAELESKSLLNTLEVRGTVRLALKQAGLEPRHVTPEQMRVVLERIMPGELESRAVTDAESVCLSLVPGLSCLAAGTEVETPEDVFKRLSG